MGVGSNPLTLMDVRKTCLKVVQSEACLVSIDDDAILDFLSSVDRSTFKQQVRCGRRFPIKFPNLQAEVNCYGLLNLLNFGSAFRHDLHQHCRREVYETMLFGILGLHISLPRVDAKFMSTLNVHQVASYFDIPLERDEEISPGIYISKPGPLRPLADMIVKVMQETGQLLMKQNFSDLGAFILSNLSAIADGAAPSATNLVEKLSAIPAFYDQACCGAKRAVLLKNAQVLVAELHNRFLGDENKQFDFNDIAALTACSDNVLPLVLLNLNVLKLSDEIASHMDSNVELTSEQGANLWIDLRAAAVIACERISKASNAEFSAIDLGFFFHQMEAKYKCQSLERYISNHMCFY